MLYAIANLDYFDQPARPRSLIREFTVCINNLLLLSILISGFWSVYSYSHFVTSLALSQLSRGTAHLFYGLFEGKFQLLGLGCVTKKF